MHVLQWPLIGIFETNFISDQSKIETDIIEYPLSLIIRIGLHANIDKNQIDKRLQTENESN